MGDADEPPTTEERDSNEAVGQLTEAEELTEAEAGSTDTNRDAAEHVRPLTDAEHAEHITEVRGAVESAQAAGLSTDRHYTTDEKRRVWSYGRRVLHDAIIDDLYAKGASLPCEGKAILAGGLPGAGKTTVLSSHAGIDLSRYLVINPDDIKQEMARRGMIPQVDGLSPMEASDLAHEEASHIAKRLASRAQAEGKNLVWDITMSSKDSTERRIGDLRAAGYNNIEGIFIDIPPEVSARRADARHREEHDAYRAGQGFGGRYIPADAILARADPHSGTDSRRTFEQLKHRFDTWRHYDNAVERRAPTLAAASTPRDDEPAKEGSG